jgi:hypothetical protein
VRLLDPSRVPPSCEACGHTELLEINLPAWEFFCTYPGVLKPAGGMTAGLYVDYAPVFPLAQAEGIEDAAFLIRQLEAIARGYHGGQ